MAVKCCKCQVSINPDKGQPESFHSNHGKGEHKYITCPKCGAHMLVWKKENGKWYNKTLRDMKNSDSYYNVRKKKNPWTDKKLFKEEFVWH